MQKESAILTGVGVGPGNPQFLTLAAISAVKTADLVLAPTAHLGECGRAEAVIREVIPDLTVKRILFNMEKGKSGIDLRRDSTFEAAKDVVTEILPNKSAVFLTLGDPNIFSTFSLLATMVTSIDPTVQVHSIPGIMAFQALISQANITLLDEEESLTLLTGLEANSRLDEVLSLHDNAIVIYKCGQTLDFIAHSAAQSDRLEHSIVGISLGMHDSRIEKLGASQHAPYFSTVVIPPKRTK